MTCNSCGRLQCPIFAAGLCEHCWLLRRLERVIFTRHLPWIDRPSEDMRPCSGECCWEVGRTATAKEWRWPAGIGQTGSGASPSQTGAVPEGGQEKEPGASPVPCASGTKNSCLERSQDPDRGGQEEKERRQNVPQKRKSREGKQEKSRRWAPPQEWLNGFTHRDKLGFRNLGPDCARVSGPQGDWKQKKSRKSSGPECAEVWPALRRDRQEFEW